MKVFNFALLGLAAAGQETNGEWHTSNGDVIQLEGNQMFIFGTDGSFTNTVAVVSENVGFSSLTFQDQAGKSTTGFLVNGADFLMFPDKEVWNRAQRDGTTTTEMPEETTLLPPSEFADIAGSWDNDNGDEAVLVDNGGGQMSVMFLEDGDVVFFTVADVTTDVNGDTVLSWMDNGSPVTATINSSGSRITFTGTFPLSNGFDGNDWFRSSPSTAPATTAPATTAAETTPAPTTAAATTAASAGATTVAPGTTAVGGGAATTTANAVLGGAAGGATTTGGAGALTTADGSAGLAGIMGDPHVKIQIPNEEAICFDFNYQKDAEIYLIRDDALGLSVTAKLTNDRQKFNRPVHSHISGVKIESKESTIEFHFCREESKLKLTVQGEEFDISHDERIYLEDGFVDVESHLRARHQGIWVRFDNGPQMHVSAKESKQSLRFDLTNSKGISSAVEGLLGHSIRPADYHILENGDILVEGRKITGAERTWMDHGYCHVLSGDDILTFLGKTIDQILVQDSLTGTLEENGKPK